MRGYSYNRPTTVAIGERLIAAASYLSVGVFGFFWIIIAHVTNSRVKNFVKFHIFQSIFIAILYYLFRLILNILLGVANEIPVIGYVINLIYEYVFEVQLILNFSIADFTALLVIVYLIINSLLARSGNIPWVSNVVKGML